MTRNPANTYAQTYGNMQMRISNPLGKDVALEVTVSFVKSTNLTYKTHSGLIDRAITMTSLIWRHLRVIWVNGSVCSVSARQSVVAGSISIGGVH